MKDLVLRDKTKEGQTVTEHINCEDTTADINKSFTS